MGQAQAGGSGAAAGGMRAPLVVSWQGASLEPLGCMLAAVQGRLVGKLFGSVGEKAQEQTMATLLAGATTARTVRDTVKRDASLRSIAGAALHCLRGALGPGHRGKASSDSRGEWGAGLGAWCEHRQL